MSAMTSKIEINPIDERAYTSLYDNFVCSKYTTQEIEALLDRLAKKKYVVDTNCPNCGAPIGGPFCEYCETVFDISETKKILAFKETERIHKETMDAMLEYTPEEVENIHAMAMVGNLTASEERRLRGIYVSSFF